MTYYVSSGTLNLTKPKPKPKENKPSSLHFLAGCHRRSLNQAFIVHVVLASFWRSFFVFEMHAQISHIGYQSAFHPQ